jgi:hypothetical protein
MRPDRSALPPGSVGGVWLGSDRAYFLAARGGSAAWGEIPADMDANPQLFSSAEDGDCYAWLERLGCYSPIVHLEQTDGRSSAHLPFTDDQNRLGKIAGALYQLTRCWVADEGVRELGVQRGQAEGEAA